MEDFFAVDHRGPRILLLVASLAGSSHKIHKSGAAASSSSSSSSQHSSNNHSMAPTTQAMATVAATTLQLLLLVSAVSAIPTTETFNGTLAPSTACMTGSACAGAGCSSTINGVKSCCLGSSCSISVINGACTCGDQPGYDHEDDAGTHPITAAEELTVDKDQITVDDGAASWCSWDKEQKSISSYSFQSWKCSNWGTVDRATFDTAWRSVNKDAIKISYGWCPTGCTGSYRDSQCSWGSEKSSNDNFDHAFHVGVTNSHFKTPVSCVQMKCDNWAQSCQVVVDRVEVV